MTLREAVKTLYLNLDQLDGVMPLRPFARLTQFASVFCDIDSLPPFGDTQTVTLDQRDRLLAELACIDLLR